MKTIFIAGPWGSGTSALAGALYRLGVPALSPFHRTNDPHTPVSYEWRPFRQLMLRHVSEMSLSRITDRSQFISELRRFQDEAERGDYGAWPSDQEKVLLLKMPIASIRLPEIAEVMDPIIVMVHRPLDEIEKTRIHRGWDEVVGSKGATVIYSRILQDLFLLRKSYLAISYNHLISDTRLALQSVIDFCGLKHLQIHLDAACATVRQDGSQSVIAKD